MYHSLEERIAASHASEIGLINGPISQSDRVLHAQCQALGDRRLPNNWQCTSESRLQSDCLGCLQNMSKTVMMAKTAKGATKQAARTVSDCCQLNPPHDAPTGQDVCAKGCKPSAGISYFNP